MVIGKEFALSLMLGLLGKEFTCLYIDCFYICVDFMGKQHIIALFLAWMYCFKLLAKQGCMCATVKESAKLYRL